MQGTEETEKFCQMFDRFFDMLNTRIIHQEIRSRKPDLAAYETVDDSRFEVFHIFSLQCGKFKNVVARANLLKVS